MTAVQDEQKLVRPERKDETPLPTREVRAGLALRVLPLHELPDEVF